MKELKNCIELSCSVKIYVPSTICVDQEADTQEWVDKALNLLAECFGGATCSEALGVWQDSDNKGLVKEKVKVCMSYCHQDALNKHIEDILAFCQIMRHELSQQSVALEVQNKMYLI
jgi:hypothetical protein